MNISMRARRATPPPIPTDVPELVNRRAARRRRVQIEVVLHPLLDPERNPWISRPRRGTARNLTEHGLLVRRTGCLPLGAVVRLFFWLSNDDPVSCLGRVVRHELWGRPRYGIKFINLSPSDALRIRRFLSS